MNGKDFMQFFDFFFYCMYVREYKTAGGLGPPVSLKPDVERHLSAVFGKTLTVCLVELRLLGSSLNMCGAWVTVKSHHMLFVSSTSHKKFSEGK